LFQIINQRREIYAQENQIIRNFIQPHLINLNKIIEHLIDYQMLGENFDKIITYFNEFISPFLGKVTAQKKLPMDLPNGNAIGKVIGNKI